MTLYDEEHLDEVCAANIAKFQSQNKEQRNESSLCHLLATFFNKVTGILPPLSSLSERSLLQSLLFIIGTSSHLGKSFYFVRRNFSLYLRSDNLVF
jgi:hypothetical protein